MNSSLFCHIARRNLHVGFKQAIFHHLELNFLIWRLCKLVAFHLTFHGYHRTFYLFHPRSTNVFLLNFSLLDSPFLIDDIGAFWDMSLCYIRSILSTAILTLNIMVIIRRRRWRHVPNVSATLLDFFHLSHNFKGVLKIFMLNFPFSRLCI